jgi:predicted transcriptional regulator
MNAKHTFVVMVKEKWWNEFKRHNRQGKQVHSYVQKGLRRPKAASLLLFYVTKPVGEVAGYAQFIERKFGDAYELWNTHGCESVMGSLTEYEEFIGDKLKISFIRFKNLHEAARPIPLNNLLLLLAVKRLARGGFFVDKETSDKLIALME